MTRGQSQSRLGRDGLCGGGGGGSQLFVAMNDLRPSSSEVLLCLRQLHGVYCSIELLFFVDRAESPPWQAARIHCYERTAFDRNKMR